ncbi:MAG: CtsR family transcriptional regulator [Firmicutes bacterium]|nr:CtsR family transcriptional regulator [Bacillota bacterium]
MNMADLIEKHIKNLLNNSNDNQVVLRRNELAQIFGCAPSQINYVIQTRFSVEKGYVIESQRGGGGFVRVMRLDLSKVQDLPLKDLSNRAVSQRQALDIICWLRDHDLISAREARIMSRAVDRAVLELPLPERDLLRSRLLVSMLTAIIAEE